MAGFTMVEIVTVIVVTTVLAAVAAPRFMGRSGFDSRGFSDQAQGTVRYAQKVAVGKRRNVFVDITAGSVSACYDAACTTPVVDPVSAAPLVVTPPAGSGVTLAPVTSFSFNGLGQPSLVANLTVTVSVAGEADRTFTIQRETGYVAAP